jgi:hypothetical protein
MKRPALTRYAEAALNPLIGKSLVIYATKAGAGEGTATKGTSERAGSTAL